MGIADPVTIERAYHEFGIRAGTTLETKSLYANGIDFTISARGILIQHVHRYESRSDGNTSAKRQPTLTRVHVIDKPIAYHGDIYLNRIDETEGPQEMVVRFTHGHLEWLCPLEDYPEENQRLLAEQGAR